MDLSRQYDRIYRYCWYRLRHRERAEDVTQETFLRFYRAYPQKERTLQLLYTIARHLCADEFRREPGLSLLPQEDCGFEETSLESVSLRDALDRLAEDDRELLLLRYVNEVPVQTLCGLFGMSRFALYRRCHRLLHELKQRLEESP